MGEKLNHKAEIRTKMEKIDISNGVSQKEAVIIAQNYLIEEGFDEKDINIYKATAEDSQLFDKCWAIAFDATYKTKSESSLEWYVIHIDKKTGKIKSHGWGPS